MFSRYLPYIGLGIALVLGVASGLIFTAILPTSAEIIYAPPGPILSNSSQSLPPTSLTYNSPQTVQSAIPFNFSSPTAVYCADATNGSDSNSGVAAGSYPNYTNCKKNADAAIGVLTAGATLYMTGVFRNPQPGTNNPARVLSPVAHFPNVLTGTAAQPTLITSYGPQLAADPISGAAISAWIDGSDCLGQFTGECAGAFNSASPASWSLVSGNIYKTAYTAPVDTVYIDNIPYWPDGPNSDGTQGLIAASCVGPGACVDSVTAASNLTLFANATYGANTDLLVPTSNSAAPYSEWWHTAAGGVGAGANPTCTACQTGVTTATDGAITWVFEGPGAGKVGPMQQGSWFWDGQFIYVWTQQGDSPANHVIEAVNSTWGFKIDGNAPNFNFVDITHIGFRHTGVDGLLIRSLSGTTCENGNNVLYSIIQQTGPSNVDLAQFGNGMRFEDGFSVGATNGNCSASTANIEHNFIQYNGEHGGSLTLQVGNYPVVEAFNNIAHANHAGINNVGATNGCTGCQIFNNYIHDNVRSGNNQPNSVGGIYTPGPGANVTIAGNYIVNIYDHGFCGASQCMGIQQNAGSTNNIIENNTIDGCQIGLQTSGGSTTFKYNILNNIIAAQSAAAPIATHTGELTVSDYNVLTSNATVATFNGTTENFTAWQGLGFDTHSLNSNATYTPGGPPSYPFLLAPGSAGLGLAASVGGFGGFNGANAGANQFVNGWQQ